MSTKQFFFTFFINCTIHDFYCVHFKLNLYLDMRSKTKQLLFKKFVSFLTGYSFKQFISIGVNGMKTHKETVYSKLQMQMTA